jgi:ABC-type lipopolysaccharide export system ATPase subunit
MKILFKNGHTDVNLIELGGEFTKAEICKILASHPNFQDEVAQGAIHEYVVRNAPQIKDELEEMQVEVEITDEPVEA